MEDILIELEQLFVLLRTLAGWAVGVYTDQLGEKIANQFFYAHFVVLFTTEGLCGCVLRRRSGARIAGLAVQFVKIFLQVGATFIFQ